MKSIFMNVEKGEYNYFSYFQKRKLFFTLLWFAFIAIILDAGYIYHGTVNNVMTVAAIILVLPASKLLVPLLLSLRYKAVDKEAYDEMRKTCGEGILYTNCFFSVKEKIAFADYVMITDSTIVLYMSQGKFEKSYVESGVKEFLSKCEEKVDVYLYTDLEKMKSKITSLLEKPVKQHHRERVEAAFQVLIL